MKVKKLFCLFFILIMFIPAPVFAKVEIATKTKVEASKKLPCKAIMLTGRGNQILLGKNYDQKLPIASLTKIMTMIILAEKIEKKECSLSDMITTSDVAKSMPTTKIFLDVDEEMTVEDMLKAVAMASANDAAVAIAEHIGGTEGDFVNLMNVKAEELNMNNTHFVDACGLEDAGYSTARDVAIMAWELLTKHPWIMKYTSKYADSVNAQKNDGSGSSRKIPIFNTNKLVRSDKEVTGLKTGTTTLSGLSLCASKTIGYDNGNGGSENKVKKSDSNDDNDEKDKMSLIAVCLGAQPNESKTGSEVREEICKRLLDYGFSNFKMLSFDNSDQDEINKIAVDGGQKSFVEVGVVKNLKSVLIKKGTSSNVEKTVKLENETLKAPVKKNQIVGKMIYSLDGKEILKCDVVTKEEIKKVNFGFLFLSVVKNFFAGINLV